uniref:Fmp27_GFWDK domain-containing protein n=1 Tax=Panagrellus redivivus TaxID=6233 RepID=A0A7E4W368_PANRE
MWWLIYVGIFVATVVGLCRRYLTWCISKLLARHLKCKSVRLSGFGLFRIDNVKLVIRDGLSVEIHDFRMSSSFVNQEHRKPIMFTAADLRVESAAALFPVSGLPRIPKPATNQAMTASDGLARMTQWLQYIGAKVHTSNVVLLDAVPDCLVHITFEGVSLETYLDREGLQVELLCKLIQTKLFLRKTVDAMLLDVSVAGSASVDIADGTGKLKKLGVALKNPRIVVSDGIIDYLNAHPLRRPSTHSASVNSLSPPKREKPLIRLLKRTPNINFDIDNLTLQFVAALNVESPRTLSLSMSKLKTQLDTGLQTASIELTDCSISDHAAASHFRGNLLSATIEPQLIARDDVPGVPPPFPASVYKASIQVYTPFVVLYHHDLAWWLDYARAPHLGVFFAKSAAETAEFRQATAMPANEDGPETPDLAGEQFGRVLIEAEVTDLQCQLRHAEGGSAVVFGIDLATLTADQALQEVEFGVESLWCHHAAAKPVEERLTLDFEKHAWGTTIAIGAGLAKFTQSNPARPQRLLCVQLDECQFEWEEQVVGLIVDFVRSVIRKDSNEPPNQADLEAIGQKKAALVVQLSARKLDLFFTAKRAAFLACSVANWKLESSTVANSLVSVVEQVRLVQGELRAEIPDLPLNWPTLAPDALGQLLLAHAGGCERLVFQLSNNPECREFVTRFEASVELIWSPLAYIVFFEVFDKIRKIAASWKPAKVAEDHPHDERDHISRRLLTITSDYPVEFGFRLPRDHLMRWVVPAISFVKVDNIIDLSAPTFHLAMDDHMILGLESPKFQKLAADSRMDMGRQEFRTLHNKTNKLWWWHADVLQIVFPYGYDFAAAYEEVINSVKWIKLVHGMKPKPFTIESPMWSDLKVTIKSASMQMNDDPFEVQLQTIYEVMMDEIFERERRRQILEEKIQLLLRDDPLFPKSKIDALYQKLASKDAQIYVDRVRQVQQPGAHRQLFLWSIKDFELHTFADLSLHGKDNVVKQMQRVNPEAQLNPDYMDFSTLWARAVELDIAESKMQFRDYPLPYMNIKEAYYWGTICGAEHLAGDRSIREQYVDLPEPWGTYKISRNMCPLKFYYDLYCEITDFQSFYGPCWEPCLTMISLCWNNVNSPSKDPSPVLPFWDKIRLLIHGRYSMLCKKLSTTLLASPDPYNETELMDIVWEQFGFDWVNSQFRITSAVSIFVRTASKYDDSRLLHLPTFKCGINLEWACLGPANDHHSVTPVSPLKLPEYSTNVEHDSYRCFRSSHLDIAMNIDVKGAGDDVHSTKGFPQVLMYANTVKWFDFLKNTMTMVNRPVKRGPLFGVPHVKKQQLSRHFRRLHLTATLPRFMITYWMSSSSLSHGFRFFCKSLQLVFAVDLKVSPNEVQDGVRRRPTTAWKTSLFSVQLEDAQLRLYGASCQPEVDDLDPSLEDSKAFFLGLSRMSYNRETTGSLDWNLRNNAQAILEAARLRPAVHRITIHDLRASWTVANRDTCLAIMDGLQKAHLLKSVLGQDAMKILEFAETSMPATVQTGRGRTSDDASKSPARHAVPLHHTLSNANASEDGGASSLLAQLVEEAKTNLVAYSEDTIEPPTDALHGVVLSGKNDVIQAQWQIDLLNSQVVLNGCEKDGFIVMTASRASLTQRVHLPVWRNAQLLLKKSWTAMLSGMQYFAPLVIGRSAAMGRDQFRWLSKDVIEDHVVDATVNDKLNNFSATGEAVGGVVTDSSSQTPRSSPGPQLQRVASRCSCQMFFISFADILNTEEFEKALIPQMPDGRHEAKWGEHQADVDCFTLKHNMLEVCTNSEQYQIILDCVNNLVLFVDPKKKLAEENRRRRWFELANIPKEDIRAKIQAMQSELREVVAILRSLERQAFFHNRQNGSGAMTAEEEAELKRDMEAYKARQLRLIDKLAMTISCFKERAMEERSEKHRRQAMQHDDEQALIARRFEVCFEDCTWRLTDGDGQLSITEMQIRNFLYTRTARIDSSGEHLLEVGTVKVLNLLPDSKYKETLARLPLSDGTPVSSVEKTPAVRVICREMPPVGGISVKEHFEVNIAPMHAQITYRFFDKMMAFFFPGRNIDKEDQQNLDNSDDVSGHVASTPSGTLASSFSLTRRLRGAVNGSFRTKSTATADGSGHGTPDEIDKMKERAEKNQVFVYIIIPQVTFVVSYKGNKEKNIEDVDRFTFTFPVCEYHDKNWTWLDLALAVKQRCKRMLLQQFMTQKFLRKPGIADRSTGAAAVEPFDEEEKKRILLGTMTPVASKSKKSKS